MKNLTLNEQQEIYGGALKKAEKLGMQLAQPLLVP